MDPPTYRISYLPMCFFSYLSGSCTYFLISCFLTTHLTYLLTISLKNHPWKVDSLLSPLTPDGHCRQSLLATRTTCCPSGVRGRNFLPLHYIINKFRFCRAGPGRPSVTDPSSVTDGWTDPSSVTDGWTDYVNLYVRYPRSRTGGY